MTYELKTFILFLNNAIDLFNRKGEIKYIDSINSWLKFVQLQIILDKTNMKKQYRLKKLRNDIEEIIKELED
jgi:hypothetical protein